MSFRITGLDPTGFQHLWDADPDTLTAANAIRLRADTTPGYPDRITLEDASIGQEVILLNHASQPADTPFRATHAIYVTDGSQARFDAIATVPPAMLKRPQSLRGFDATGMMRAADLAEGDAISEVIQRLFDDPEIIEIHAHNARQGCFMARITRA